MNLGTILEYLVVFVCLHELYAKYRARRLPPGTSGLWCILELPKEKPWLKMLKFNRKYGDFASASLFGYDVILVSCAKIAGDLLEKRSINYANRPRSVMGGELSGWGKMMVLCDYTDWFRFQRKWIAQEIGSHANIATYQTMFEVETRRTLRSVLAEPDRVRTHLRKNFTSIVLRISHGYITQDGEDPLVELAEVANSQLSRATTAGGHYVDFVPLLKYIPSWFPGAGFKRRAKEYAAVVHDILEIPYNYVLSQLASGTALPSLCSRLLSMPDLTEVQQDNIKWAALTMYRGSADTTTSLTYAFYLAMTLYPRVMKKAQEELDSVIGTGRLPSFADRAALPTLSVAYLKSAEHVRFPKSQNDRLLNESPLALRRTTADDEYDGYLIPAGSYVVVNMWAILRDERTYKDPLEFRPERFLGIDPERHPWSVCFGFGRRRCPGSYLAYSSVWLVCAQTLAAFDISKRVENGAEVTPAFDQVGATIIHPAPFECTIRPRSGAAERLIKEEVSM